MSSNNSIDLVDDSSSSITYSGSWTSLRGNPLNFDGVYQDSLHGTDTIGSTASYSFQASVLAVQAVSLFNGTDDAPQVLFTLDGVSPPPFQPNSTFNGSPSVWYTTPTDLDATVTHTLAITFLGPSGANFFLDAIATGAKGDVGTSGSGLGGKSIAPTSPQPTSLSTSSPGGGGSRVPVGAIVGGAIGGVALLVGTLLALYFLCLRHKNRRPYYYGATPAGEILSSEVKQISPFNPDTPGTSTYTTPAPSTYSGAPSAFNAPQVQAASAYGGYGPYNGGAGHAAASVDGSEQQSSISGGRSVALSVANAGPQNTAGLTVAQRKALEAGVRTFPEASGGQESDSGLRFTASGEPSSSTLPADAPPAYMVN